MRHQPVTTKDDRTHRMIHDARYDMDVTREAYFMMAKYFRVADWFFGVLGAFSTTVCTVWGGLGALDKTMGFGWFPPSTRGLPLILRFVLPVSAACLAVANYCKFNDSYVACTKAGVQYNILRRNAHTIASKTETEGFSETLKNEWTEFSMKRDKIEEVVALPIFDIVYKQAKTKVTESQKNRQRFLQKNEEK